MVSAMDRVMTLASGLLIAVATTSAPRLAFASDDDPWWGRDKALHFVAGSAVAAGGYAAGTAFWTERSRSVALGVGLALLAGAAKEALDAAGLGTPSWKDFAWDAIGAACGAGVAVVFDVGVHGGTVGLQF